MEEKAKENIEQMAYPSFATWTTNEGTFTEYHTGLTKREYFAGLAMQGLIANAPNGHLANYKEGVELAIKWSDELLKQLEDGK